MKTYATIQATNLSEKPLIFEVSFLSLRFTIIKIIYTGKPMRTRSTARTIITSPTENGKSPDNQMNGVEITG